MKNANTNQAGRTMNLGTFTETAVGFYEMIEDDPGIGSFDLAMAYRMPEGTVKAILGRMFDKGVIARSDFGYVVGPVTIEEASGFRPCVGRSFIPLDVPND